MMIVLLWCCCGGGGGGGELLGQSITTNTGKLIDLWSITDYVV